MFRPGRLRVTAQVAVLLALLLAFWGLPDAARAQARDPALEWRTFETPHFRVHYHAPLGHLARRVAAAAEAAHGRLTNVMGFEPASRVELLLSDEADDANGSATALPYDTIRLYAEPPDDLSPLADYDDWMTMLVTHEHLHILHLDQASGVPALVNAVLGKVYMPNHVSPRWLLEGFAVWQETESTAAGRLRSTQWNMYLRADALEGRMWSLDQVTTGADRWPHGNAAYLYGSFFIDYIARHHGREALASMVREYGGSLVPYGISRVAHHATGRTLEELWSDFQQEASTRAQSFRAGIEVDGVVEGERLTHHGEYARAPRFLRDGRLVYQRADARSRPRLVVVDPPGDVSTELARMNSGGEAAVAPDGRTLVFSRVDSTRDVYFYSDLFTRDLETGEERRLTSGLRAREPDVSPDGRLVAFTTSRAGQRHLHVAEIHDIVGTMREFVLGGETTQVYTPRFSPDGRTLAVSRWSPGGLRDIALVDVETGHVEDVTHDRALDTGPVWAPDGRSVFFSSDRTGAANVFEYLVGTGALIQRTNVVLGAYQPAIAADGSVMVYVGYTSRGFDLFTLPRSEWMNRPAPVYRDARPPPSNGTALWTAESHSYDPLPTLYPRSYMLDVGQDSWGPQVGISIAAEDLLAYHQWSARLGIGLARGTWQLDASYRYSGSPLGVGIDVYRTESAAGGLDSAGNTHIWSEEAVGASAGIGYSFPRSFRTDSVSLSYSVASTRATSPWLTEADYDPNAPLAPSPQTGTLASLRFGWSYSDVERYAYDISSSNGRAISLATSVSDPRLGGLYQVLTLTWAIQQYVPLWEHHVLALRYAGGFSGGDTSHRATFAVGGFPSTNPLSSFASLSAPASLGGAALRGYPYATRLGSQYHLAQVEYRLPIVRFNAGHATLPAYLNRLYALAFFDVGDAFFGSFDVAELRTGAGVELLLDFTLFYLLGFSLRVGYAHGFGAGGIDQLYGHLGVPF